MLESGLIGIRQNQAQINSRSEGSTVEPATTRSTTRFRKQAGQDRISSAATSGRVSVATPDGIAVSAADFFVPPGSYTAADVNYTGRMAIGESETVTISSANKIGLVVFDGIINQRVSLNCTSVTVSSFVSIYRPDGSTLLASIFVGSTKFIDTFTLTATGTYTILIDPTNSNTGSMTLTSYEVIDATGTITISGPSVNVTTSTPGQNALLTFSGTASNRISLRVTNATYSSCTVRINNPDGTQLGALILGSSTGFIDTKVLPATGTYTIEIDPSNLHTGGMTLTLYDVPADYSGTITPGGSSVTVTITTPGQNAQLSFSGTSGQKVSLNFTSVTVGSNVSITNPDGSTLLASTSVTSTKFIDTMTLPATGTYTIHINPSSANTGSLTVTLYDVADITATITPGGSAVAITIATPGQNAEMTFNGTSGQQVTVRITGNTIGTVQVRLLKPDGTLLTSLTSGNTNFNLSTQTLPTTGTYTITINPSGGNTGGMNVSPTTP